MALWVATPKVYIHDLLHHDHSENTISAETKIKSQSTDDCDFEKYNKPTYFSVFKFIFSFLPIKSKDSDKTTAKSFHVNSISYAISLLRGPPTSE